MVKKEIKKVEDPEEVLRQLNKLQQKEYADAKDLMFVNDEYDVLIKFENQEFKVKIQPMTLGILAKVRKQAKDDEMLMMAYSISECLLEPKLTVDEVMRMKYPILLEIFNQISKISGLDEATLRKAEGFPIQAKAGH